MTYILWYSKEKLVWGRLDVKRVTWFRAKINKLQKQAILKNFCRICLKLKTLFYNDFLAEITHIFRYYKDKLAWGRLEI